MSLWRREHVGLGVGMEGVAWWHPSAGFGGVSVEPLSLSGGAQGAGERLQTVVEQALQAMTLSRRSRIDVVLADSLVRYWIMDVPPGTASLSEMRAVAQARCSQLFGDVPAAWSVTGDWLANGPLLCAAIPRWLLQTLRRTLPSAARIDPMLCRLLQAARRRLVGERWVCVTTPYACAVLSTAAGRIASLRILRATKGAPIESVLDVVATELHRESLRLQRPLENPVAWLQMLPDQANSVTVKGIRFKPMSEVRPEKTLRADVSDDEAWCAAWLAARQEQALRQ